MNVQEQDDLKNFNLGAIMTALSVIAAEAAHMWSMASSVILCITLVLSVVMSYMIEVWQTRKMTAANKKMYMIKHGYNDFHRRIMGIVCAAVIIGGSVVAIVS